MIMEYPQKKRAGKREEMAFEGDMMPPLSVALIGNPNCGKTTLFNALTGEERKVGNWPGVTVDCGTAAAYFGDRVIEFADLPGIYSLDFSMSEEQGTKEWIHSGRADVAVNVIDASVPERSLYLTQELLKEKIPVVVALNRMDAAESAGIFIDTKKLSEELGNIPVIAVWPREKRGLGELSESAVSVSSHPRGKNPNTDIEDIILKCVTRNKEESRREKLLDELTLHPVWGVLFFACVMAIVFFAAFGAGNIFRGLLGTAFSGFLDILRSGLCEAGVYTWLISLLIDGVGTGVGSVLAFIPVLAVLFVLLAVLEDSGYMSRTAYVMNGALRFAGLSGRGCLPLLLGFGCTVPAVMAARIMETCRARRRVILMAPYMSCSARLPVYVMLAGVFFPERSAITVFSLYMLGAGVAAVLGRFSSCICRESREDWLLLEIPPLRLPDIRTVCENVRQRMEDYIFKAGTVIFAGSLLLWVLLNFGPSGFGAEIQESYAAVLGRFLSPLLAPAGLDRWRIAAALLTGLAAKEMIVSGVYVLYGTGGLCNSRELLTALISDGFGAASALSMAVFCLLYPPCMAAMGVIWRETHSVRSFISALFVHLAVAWGASVLVYQLCIRF